MSNKACMYSAQGELLCGAAAASPAAAIQGMYGDLPVASYAPVAASLAQQYEQAAPVGRCPAAALPMGSAKSARPQQASIMEQFFAKNLPMGTVSGEPEPFSLL